MNLLVDLPDICLFIVLFLKCWNGKNHLILSDIKQNLCFDYILLCSLALILNTVDMVFLLFCCLFSFKMQLYHS
jgi:hypothetical protein